MSTLAVRPALPEDEIFLYDLYAAIRGPEFALASITPAQRLDLLRMQFRAQLTAYTASYPHTSYDIVLLDGKPVGRLWVAQDEEEFHLVDIAIHPDLQRKGIATTLMQRLQQEAAKARLPIRCSVLRFNPASLRLHERMGFTIVREDEMYFQMEWRPAILF
jgi:ribosomal protein S18 acetylase RimI-like enzyme